MDKLRYSINTFISSFIYSENSPTGLLSKISGKPIGSFERDSEGNRRYSRVKLGNQRYLTHRVIWVLTYGEIDENLVIDHIDGNPWNNKLENLRLVDRKTNQRNRKKLKLS